MFCDRYQDYQPVKVLCASYSIQAKSQNMTYKQHTDTIAAERQFQLNELKDDKALKAL
jgi:hypothetical protein